MRREEAGVGRREVPQAKKGPLDVAWRLACERREEIPGVASDAPNARDRLQMAGIDGHTHRS